MSENTPTMRAAPGFLRHVGFWILVLLAVYVVYVFVDAALRPNPDRLPELAARLPFIVGQIIPVAVFAATTGRSGLFGGAAGAPSRSNRWVGLVLVAGAAYAVMAWADPLLAPLTGSDALFPADLDRALEAARDAAGRTSGEVSAAHSDEAGRYLLQLVVPYTAAAIVLVAALLGSFGCRVLGHWELDPGDPALVVRFATSLRDMLRWLMGGFYASACWVPLQVADLIASEPGTSAATLFAWMLSMHLAVPLLMIAFLAVLFWLDNRKSRESRRV